MTNRDLKYSLSLGRSDFDDADRLVRATILSQKQKGLLNYPAIVTETQTHLLPGDQEYIEKWDNVGQGKLEGLCCWAPGSKHEFNIWLSPHMDPYSDLYRISLLHELVHGYLHEPTHGERFRSLLGRVTYHYCDIVSALEAPGFQVVAMNYRYTRQRKAESSDDFFRRLVQNKEDIQSTAETEYHSVLDMYERIA